MPTYNAIGLSASLTVADLASTCSNVIDKRMREQQRLDAERIDNIFSTAIKLPENVVGADGSTSGAMQFLGAKHDIPVFVVEAGANVQPVYSFKGEVAIGDHDSDSLKDAPSDPFDDADLPLSSLATTPSPAKFGLANSSPQRGILNSNNRAKALCLTVSASDESFLPKAPKSNGLGIDLKMEVFINGELVGISFVNTRGAAVELKDNRVRFTGTRVHRQLEKPWVYRAEAGQLPPAQAEERWAGICSKLKEEASLRGCDQYGDCCPSSELLLALSEMNLPERVRDKSALAVVDLAITAGTGSKYGPTLGYVTEPTRMIDPGYSGSAEGDTMQEVMHGAVQSAAQDEMTDMMQNAGTPPPPSLNAPFDEKYPFNSNVRLQHKLADSSPEVPLAQNSQPRPKPVSETPPRRRRPKAIDDEYDAILDRADLDKIIAPFENSRGRVQTNRTLRQRLTDIRQMNANNRRKALHDLKDDVSEQQLNALENALLASKPVCEVIPQSPARNESRYGKIMSSLADTLNPHLETGHFHPRRSADMSVDATTEFDRATINPTHLHAHPCAPTLPQLDESAFPDLTDIRTHSLATLPPNSGLPSLPPLDPGFMPAFLPTPLPAFGPTPTKQTGPPLPPYSDYDAKLDEERIALAIASGAEPDGPLVRQIIRSAHCTPEKRKELERSSRVHNLSQIVQTARQTPEKRSRASALAGSPCSVPVKGQARSKPTTPSPHEGYHGAHRSPYGPPIPINSLLASSLAKKATAHDSDASISSPSKSGGKRNRNVWNPDEQTSEQAISNFKIPDLCKGSSVGYVEGTRYQRQIGKARGGTFKEEQVVVGMRWLVV